MGAHEDFKRLAKEMAEKARAQREKAAQAAREQEHEENGEENGDAGRRPPEQERKKNSG